MDDKRRALLFADAAGKVARHYEKDEYIPGPAAYKNLWHGYVNAYFTLNLRNITIEGHIA